MLAHTAPERAVATLCHDQLSVIVWTSNFTLKGQTKKVCQNTSSLSVVVLFSDISRALYRVLVNTFPEINLLFMGRGTSQAQKHQISVANNRLSERACGAL
jgi:hypothetical protein